jgi:hypothetical protein
MTAPVPSKWEDPNVRQQFLDDTGWANKGGPNIKLSEKGLPQHYHDWTLADRHAYTWLLEKSGDPQGVGKAFFLSHIKRMPDAELINLAERDAETIARIFPRLQMIVGRFEALIRSRWGKRKEAARRDLLKKVWSDLPKKRRPDHRCLRTMLDKICLSGNCFLYPHLTVDGLIKRNALLHLLSSRGRHEPSAFVQLDLQTRQIGRRSTFLVVDCRDHRMDLSSDISSGRYGSIQDTFTREDLEAICSHRAMGLSDGSQVLRVQADILVFLP